MRSVIGTLRVLILAGTVALTVSASVRAEQTVPASACWRGDAGVLFASCQSDYSAAVIFKDAGTAWIPDGALPDLIVSGTYTSTEFKVMGMAIDAGTVVNKRANGWDGAILIDADGQIRLGAIDNLAFEGRRYRLYSSLEDRKAFLNQVAAGRKRGAPISLLQSHLLVTGGKIDVRPQSDAKAFRRRMLVETMDGHILILDTGADALTLYGAAQLAANAYHARYAVNLDMGTYDYCMRKNADGLPTPCGFLATTTKLTNMIAITRKS